MFPLQQKDELFFGTTTTTTDNNNTNIIISPPTDNMIFGQDLIVEDHHHHHHHHGFNNNISFDSNSIGTKNIHQTRMKFSVGSKREATAAKEIKKDGINNDEADILRKVMHRDYERQRRQEMSTRFASLRSLLPLEHIKGKRSLSDHMHEATNYIKQLEKNVEELRIRRDKLRKLPINSGSSNGGENMPNCVTVKAGNANHGIEVLISCSNKNSDQFRLSGVIKELLDRNMNVVSCVSTKNIGTFLYNIQAEACDKNLIDLSMLQQRLNDVIN